MAEIDPSRVSSYLDQLPALFQEGDVEFLGRLLLAFEHVLSGIGDIDDPGLEELLDGAVEPSSGRVLTGVERYFDPGVRESAGLLPAEQRAPAEFLEWLASWVGAPLRSHMTETQRRELIARAVPLYRKRGTREGLEQLLAVQAGLQAKITDASTPPRPGAPDVSAGGPHYFHVQINMSQSSIEDIGRQSAIVHAILEAEKPAHTTYAVDFDSPELQIGVTSHVGIDTLIGKPRYGESS
jgi:phage tail-like protein